MAIFLFHLFCRIKKEDGFGIFKMREVKSISKILGGVDCEMEKGHVNL